MVELPNVPCTPQTFLHGGVNTMYVDASLDVVELLNVLCTPQTFLNLTNQIVYNLAATRGVFYDDEVRTKRQKLLLWKALIFSCFCYV